MINYLPKVSIVSVKRYLMAAEQGSADAQYNLGVMYANGNGVPKDNTEAVKWYRSRRLTLQVAQFSGLAQGNSHSGRWARNWFNPSSVTRLPAV